MAETTKKSTSETQQELKPGMTVRVHQKIKEKNAKGEEKERIQVFEGLILKQRHGKEIGATITVRKVSDGIGVEKVFPIHSPILDKIEVVKIAKVRRANVSYLRNHKKRLKEKSVAKAK
jgi:large subunit ribosomal protein L19